MAGIGADEVPKSEDGAGAEDMSKQLGGDPLDLSECEREPIHLLEHIQPHGGLLAVAAEGEPWRVTHASANIHTLLGVSAEDLLGRPLDATLAPALAALLRARAASCLARDAATETAPQPATESHTVTAPAGPATWTVTAFRSGARVVIEIEPVHPSPCGDGSRADAWITRSGTPAGPDGAGWREVDAPHRLGDETVRAVAEATGHDRVMLYMFHPDWSGEVIAETRRPDLEPYLGLRYPASDIPAQARHLYTINLLRTIVDVAARPVPVLSEPPATGDPVEPLDLTLSDLRSVSPYHIEYLRNMEVGATLTASVLVNGTLWGMIACHHRGVHPVTPAARAVVSQLATSLAERIEHRLRRAERRHGDRMARYLSGLRSRLAGGEPLPRALLTGPGRLMETLGAESSLIVCGETMAMVGLGPSPPKMRRILEAVPPADEQVFSTDHLAALLDDVDPCAAGLAVVIVNRNPLVAVGVLRPPETRQVFWAGDPSRPALRRPGRERISPRQSFAAWKETHGNHAKPWNAGDLTLLDEVGRTVRDHLRSADPQDALRPGILGLERQLTPGATLSGGLMSGSGEGLALTVEDPDGRVRLETVNRAFLDLFDDIEDGEDYVALTRRLGLPADLREHTLNGPMTCECWSRRHGRRTMEISGWTVLTIADQNGTRSWRAQSFRDVTESHRSAHALASARDRAELASRMKSEFLTRAGHDLKTPLNAILGFSDMIRLGVGASEVDDQVAEYAGIIHSAGTHLLAMIEDLLELSRFELGRQMPRDSTFDMVGLCRECMIWIKAYPGASDVALGLEVPAHPVPTRADRTIMARVLLNLLGNAVKFTPHGGTVNLTLRPGTGGTVVVEVTDTGIGIPDHEISEIFLPFRRGESPDVAAREGTGLGLATVKTMMEAHGGTVEVTSSPGAGSTFRLILPPERGPAGASRAGAETGG